MDKMINQFVLFITNKSVYIPFTAWLVAQLLKMLIYTIKNRHVDFTILVSSGGMPSSHSALVTSLSVCIARTHGVDSSIFALSAAFAFIVMYDASGVRRAAGKQASVINKLIYTHYTKEEFDVHLKELIGHTPTEVIGGACLGILLGSLLYI